MNDEIKEILDNIRKIIKSNREDNLNRIIYDCDSMEKLLDYIINLQQINNSLTTSLNKKIEEGINLQQENERLKDIIEHKPFFDFTTDIYDELEDYKSRCEKAVEYLKSKEDSLFMTFSDDILDHDELIDKKIGTTLLNILNGKE